MVARHRRHGMTIVELLIATAVLGLLLSLLTVFFSSQARTTSRTQAINEVEVTMRTAAEIIAQDLQMAGSRSVSSDSGTVYVDELQDECSVLAGAADPCIRAGGGTAVPRSIATVYYATSLRGVSELCRQVDYELGDDGTLFRSDVGCGATPVLQPFADNVQDISLRFTCSNDTEVDDPATCYGADAFPQQATISITGSSENTREAAVATVTLSTTMHNLRPVAVSE